MDDGWEKAQEDDQGQHSPSEVGDEPDLELVLCFLRLAALSRLFSSLTLKA